MFPTILQLGPLVISSLGVMIALGFIGASFLFWRQARAEHFEEEELMDICLVVSLTALIGSRLGWVALNFASLKNPLDWINVISRPGYWFYGGVIAAVLSFYWLVGKKKWECFKVSDIATFGATFFLIMQSVGSFLDGSFYGRPTNLPWAINVPGLAEKRHPSQLYQLILFTILFRLLFWLEKNYRTFKWYQNKKGEAASGFLTAVFFIFVGLIRFGVEFVREGKLYLLGLSVDQWLSLLVIIFGAGLLLTKASVFRQKMSSQFFRPKFKLLSIRERRKRWQK